MFVKFILPALLEAQSRAGRNLKYSLFPPLGLALLAGYLNPDDSAELVDEHVQKLSTDDYPDIVAIEVYVTSAYRAYEIADHYRNKGSYVILGGLHPTSMPDEALAHCDTIITGPAEQAWPEFLADFRVGNPQKIYRSTTRDLNWQPHIRRDLIDKSKYLVPNSLVVSRGCPHNCDFCYKNDFFAGGKSFYTAKLDWALQEIDNMSGRHLFFLDDNIFADSAFSTSLFNNMIPKKRLWQGAATVSSLQDEKLLDLAVKSGMRSLFIGFETLNTDSLTQHRKNHNKISEYEQVIKNLHARGVMINASFVFGMETDKPDVFDRTVDWALENSLETATFHILTPYPGSEIYNRYHQQDRIATQNWNLFDTRHAVFDHAIMSKSQLEQGYWQAYKRFYSWRSIVRSAAGKPTVMRKLRHFAYTAAWKKFDSFWSTAIRLKQLPSVIPWLERTLNDKTVK